MELSKSLPAQTQVIELPLLNLGTLWPGIQARVPNVSTLDLKMEPADSSDFLWELARVSSQQVSSLVTILARDLAAKKGAREHSERARILSQIAAELWIIGSHLEQNSPDQRLHWVRLEKHLLNLENICTVSILSHLLKRDSDLFLDSSQNQTNVTTVAQLTVC